MDYNGHSRHNYLAITRNSLGHSKTIQTYLRVAPVIYTCFQGIPGWFSSMPIIMVNVHIIWSYPGKILDTRKILSYTEGFQKKNVFSWWHKPCCSCYNNHSKMSVREKMTLRQIRQSGVKTTVKLYKTEVSMNGGLLNKKMVIRPAFQNVLTDWSEAN